MNPPMAGTLFIVAAPCQSISSSTSRPWSSSACTVVSEVP